MCKKNLRLRILRQCLFVSACFVGRMLDVSAAQSQNACEDGKRAFAKISYLEAQQSLWKCVEEGATSRESAHLLAQTYRELKNYDAGLERVRPLLAAQPRSVDLLYVKAFLLFRTGLHRESLRLLGDAYHLDAQDWRGHQLFALNYVVLQIPDGALQEFQLALQLNPSNAELYYQLARHYYSQNRVIDSITASEKALALSPGYVDVYSNLGLCYEALAEQVKARENYEKAVELARRLGKKDEWPFLNYAAFLIKQDAAEQSLQLLQAALQQNADSARAYYLQGKALRKLQNTNGAKQSLERAIALDPNDPGPYYELAAVLRTMGDTAGAREMLARFQLVNNARDKKKE
jgi:Tfp pilus assembly protein PilF